LIFYFSVEQIVCCRLAPLQSALYQLLVRSKSSDIQVEGDKVTSSSLSFITQLKKLCNRK